MKWLIDKLEEHLMSKIASPSSNKDYQKGYLAALHNIIALIKKWEKE